MYDTPRGELCCHLGRVFLQQSEYAKAIYWYHAAIDGPRSKDSPFVREECHTWLPHIQLCICYDRIKKNMKRQFITTNKLHSLYLIIRVLNIIENILMVYLKNSI